jgi:hypothetical protein
VAGEARRVRDHRLAPHVDLPGAEQVAQHLEVFAQMPGGPLERDAEAPFDQFAVRHPEPQPEPATSGGLGGLGLAGHDDRVPRVGDRDGRAKVDVGDLAGDGRDRGDRVDVEELTEPQRSHPGASAMPIGIIGGVTPSSRCSARPRRNPCA